MTTTQVVVLVVGALVGIGLALEDETPAGKVAGCAATVVIMSVVAFLIA